ncbi:MAG: hypothetical protein QM737_17700 [Ferruginibacter sp.]
MRSCPNQLRVLKSACIFFLLVVYYCPLQAQEYFTAVKNAEKENQYKVACEIYYNKIINLDSAAAVTALLQLKKIANEDNNNELKTGFLALMGDFYKEIDKADTALAYLKQALPLTIRYKFRHLQANVYGNMGWVYYNNFHDYNRGFETMLKANNIIENDIGYQNYLLSNHFLYTLGFMYYDFGNIGKARPLLYKALQYPFIKNLYQVQTYNTLALTYMSENNYDSASVYFIKAAGIAEANDFQAWIGITKGNLGLIYYNQNKIEQAKPLLQTDINLSIAHQQWSSAANSFCLYATINIKENNIAEAIEQLDSAKILYYKQPNLGTLYRYYTTRATLSKKQNNYVAAVTYLDSAKILYDSIIKRNKSFEYTRTEEKVQLERYLADKKLMESENNRLLLVRNFIIIFLILILVIAFQFIFRLRSKRKKDKQMMEVSKQQLAYYIENLRTKNELIESFQLEIDQLHSTSYVQEKEREEMSDKLKKYSILTEDHWNDFRHLFEKVHKGFFDTLKQKFPQLTQSEIRLLALLKLNLSKKEMAEMLGISPDSIKKTRQRIQSKINLPEDKHLEDLVKGI